MKVKKTLLILAAVLAFGALGVSGAAMAASDDSKTPFKTLWFHYTPFGPGKALMGPAPEPGLAYKDKAKGPVTDWPSAVERNATLKKR